MENVKVTTLGLEKLKITWKKSEAPDGYKIYRSEEKDGSYKLVKTIKDYSYNWEKYFIQCNEYVIRDHPSL